MLENRETVKPEAMKIEISSITILKIVGTLLALWIAYLIREVFAILFVSLVLSALIDPFADYLEKRKMSRGLAVLVIYLALILALAGVLLGLIPPIASEFGQLVQNFDSYLQAVLGKIPFLQNWVSTLDGAGVERSLQTFQKILFGSGEEGIVGRLSGVVAGLAAFTLVLALTFYLVVEEHAVRRFFSSITPHRYHVYLSEVLPRVQEKMGAWLRGQLILAISISVLVFVGLRILDVKYALVLALFAGLAEFVPYVGPVISAVPAVILATAQSPLTGVLTLGLYMVVQWCENHLLVPKIMQRTIGINPIVSIIALLVGAKLGGIVGAIMAIPVATAVMVFTQDFFAREEKVYHGERNSQL